MRRMIIAVLGSDKDTCTKKAYDMSVRVGREIARRGIVTLTGGGFGVMEGAAKGAKKEGGLTVGVLFEGKKKAANRYLDIVIPSGIGFARDMINANSADAVILVGGGVGTLSESTYAYFNRVPIIAMSKSGGTATKYAGKYLDKRRIEKIRSARTCKQALDKALELAPPYKEEDGIKWMRS